MAILNIIVGAALLFFGRKVFWLFVASVGFVTGMWLAANTFNGPDWLNITIGLALGFVAALLAVFVQHFAIGLAGFLGGGYIALQILPMLNLEGGWIPWVAFVIGGIIGVILVGAILDWALIILSALAGSFLIIDSIDLPQVLSVIFFVVLVLVGFLVQAKDLKREKH
jgi:hypothetical protein